MKSCRAMHGRFYALCASFLVITLLMGLLLIPHTAHSAGHSEVHSAIRFTITFDAGSGQFAVAHPNQGVIENTNPHTFDISSKEDGTVSAAALTAVPEAFRKDPDDSSRMQIATKWTPNQDGSGQELTFLDDIQLTGDINYYPVWEQASSLTLDAHNSGYSLTFGDVAGKTSDHTVVLYDKKVT